MHKTAKYAAYVLGCVALFVFAMYCVLRYFGVQLFKSYSTKPPDGIYIGLTRTKVEEANAAFSFAVFEAEEQSIAYDFSQAKEIIIYNNFEYLGLTGDMAYWFDSDETLVMSAFHPKDFDYTRNADQYYYDMFLERYGSSDLSTANYEGLENIRFAYRWTLKPAKYEIARFSAYFDTRLRDAYFVLSALRFSDAGDGVIPEAVFEVLK